MQITFNSYEEMMEFMERIKGQGVAKAVPAALATEEAEQGSVPYGRFF